MLREDGLRGCPSVRLLNSDLGPGVLSVLGESVGSIGDSLR